MAVTTVKTIDTVIGNVRLTGGTYSASDTGGNINTGLHQVLSMMLVATGGSIVADAPTINETFPMDGSAVTIIVTNATTGLWWAIGY